MPSYVMLPVVSWFALLYARVAFLNVVGLLAPSNAFVWFHPVVYCVLVSFVRRSFVSYDHERVPDQSEGVEIVAVIPVRLKAPSKVGLPKLD